jgi:Holliday junction resolvasome RuvABC endonuclease subunit
MTIRPHLSPPVLQEEVPLQQIQPLKVWTALTGEQQARVLQVLVTMCQECLVLQKEAKDDRSIPLPENHPCPS